MSLVGEAVFDAFQPSKLNYEMLGNTDGHLHCHIFPRYKNDPLPKMPVWMIDGKLRHGDGARPTQSELDELKVQLSEALEARLMATQNSQSIAS